MFWQLNILKGDFISKVYIKIIKSFTTLSKKNFIISEIKFVSLRFFITKLTF